MSKDRAFPDYPPTLTISNRHYNWRSELEHFKEQLTRCALGMEPVPLPATRPEGDELVPLKVVAKELGLCRRTIGRMIADSRRPTILQPQQTLVDA